jgi:hypothetical protein
MMKDRKLACALGRGVVRGETDRRSGSPQFGQNWGPKKNR